ncbi:YlqD family protein [Desulfurispora thermophila]|uniref:YlqD family protein n=1 Tax=Desulfurispora thermophila TaxID=265470 RepID=UPI0003718DC2|nr:YlqD family protein [Desulfurispora thermophila]
MQLLNRITITRPVLIKTIVTEQYKQQAAAGLQQELAALDASLAAVKQRLQQLQAQEVTLARPGRPGQLQEPGWSTEKCGAAQPAGSGGSVPAAAPQAAAVSLQQLRRQMEENWRQMADKRNQLLEQLKALARLPLGAEVLQGRAESLVEVGPGDDLGAIMQVEIVVRDGIIEQIRQGENTCPSK